MSIMRCTRLRERVMLLMAITLFCPVVGRADVKGKIEKKTGQIVQGQIRWQPSTKEYKVILPNNVEVPVPLDQVAYVRVEKPAALDQAIAKVQGGQFAAAVGPLQQIVRDYAMLEHDVVGTRWLADAYLKMNEPKKAADACKTLLRDNPNAFVSGDLAGVYWDALLKTQQYPELEKALTFSIQKAPREVAAVAQLKRGDMDKQKGNTKEALIDGYLRTVYFFQSVKSVQPDALFKAVKCFEELGRVADAEKMRKRLLTDYPNSPQAQELK